MLHPRKSKTKAIENISKSIKLINKRSLSLRRKKNESPPVKDSDFDFENPEKQKIWESIREEYLKEMKDSYEKCIRNGIKEENIIYCITLKGKTNGNWYQTEEQLITNIDAYKTNFKFCRVFCMDGTEHISMHIHLRDSINLNPKDWEKHKENYPPKTTLY